MHIMHEQTTKDLVYTGESKSISPITPEKVNQYSVVYHFARLYQ